MAASASQRKLCKDTLAVVRSLAMRDSRDEQPVFDASRDLELDPRALRGLAHPIRLRLRSELVEQGPATATQLAARLGESSGTTSYHLRQLATYGFVVDEPGLGNGRERYWRALHRSTWLDGSVGVADRSGVASEYLRAVARVYAERIVRYADSVEATSEQIGEAWASTANMSDWSLDLTAREAKELGQRFHELCAPYRRDPDRPRSGTRRVVVQFQLLPTEQQTS
jgi:DNA-binding transcriptional ArsR family regulator